MMLDDNGGMMWGNNDAGNWLWMVAATVVILGIIGLAVFAFRSFRPKSSD